MANLDYQSIIERLINHLEAKKLENLIQDDENIADSLWLAWQIKQKQAEENPLQSPSVSSNFTENSTTLNQENKNKSKFNLDESSTSKSKLISDNLVNIDEQESQTVPLTVDTEEFEDQELDFKGDSQYIPFQTPKAPALQNKLPISRSLRPLKRKVPSIKRQRLDIDATINLIIEQDIWFPVTKPELERWLDLELIIEQNKSVFIWEQTIAEFEQILRNNGIFRRVRTWNLNSTKDYVQSIELNML